MTRLLYACIDWFERRRRDAALDHLWNWRLR